MWHISYTASLIITLIHNDGTKKVAQSFPGSSFLEPPAQYLFFIFLSQFLLETHSLVHLHFINQPVNKLLEIYATWNIVSLHLYLYSLFWLMSAVRRFLKRGDVHIFILIYLCLLAPLFDIGTLNSVFYLNYLFSFWYDESSSQHHFQINGQTRKVKGKLICI